MLMLLRKTYRLSYGIVWTVVLNGILRNGIFAPVVIIRVKETNRLNNGVSL